MTCFVTCATTDCPMNEGKQCRAPFIAIDGVGRCFTKEAGPHANKFQTENYVDVRACENSKCNHWEQDKVTDVGICGFAADLMFVLRKGEAGENLAVCSNFNSQIEEPGFWAKVDKDE
jgi:hypothetical protein